MSTVATAMLICTATAFSATAADDYVVIATGAVTGVYFPAGGAICQLVNETSDEHGQRCYVEATGGSVANIRAVNAGSHDFGIAQSDWQFHAYVGTSKFSGGGPMDSLRSVFSLHAEPFTVVARADAGIKEFRDLIGKRVNLGNWGSGQRGTTEILMDAFGIEESDFAYAASIPASQQAHALCSNQIDAMVYTVGHPSSAIHEATVACESVLVEVTGPVIDRLVSSFDYYRKTSIPGGMYRGNEDPVKTFGVGATLITSANVPNDTVYLLTKSVFENFSRFRSLHPAFAGLERESMIVDGLSAPLHDGAARYYREVGLLQK